MDDVGRILIETEKAALVRWGKGDPDGFLEICAPDVVYFDPYRDERINGLSDLTALYETFRGKIQFDRFELVNPLVQASTDLAVLTFNYISYNGKQPLRWNCTEVFRQAPDHQWKIIQTHWSYTNVFKYHKGQEG